MSKAWRATLLVGLALASACSSGGEGADARSYTIELMTARTNPVTADSFAPPLYRTLVDHLPNTTYQEPGKDPFRGSDLVSVGRVTGVEKGPGFEGHRDPTGVAVTVPFGDRRARWNTMHLIVEVRRSWGTVPPDDLRVGVGFYPGEDFDRFSEGWEDLGELAFFLQSSQRYAYAAGVYAAGTIATVASDGRLGLPFLAPADGVAMLGATKTLDRLGQAAEGPGQVIDVERHHNTLYRRGDPAIPGPD